MTLSHDDLRAETARIAGALDAVAVGERIGRHAVSAVRELGERGDEDLEQETIVAAASNVRAVLSGLARGEAPTEATAPRESIAWVSTLAHRSISPATIPRCYCIGQAMLETELREAMRAQELPCALKWDVAAAMAQFLFAYVEKIVGDLIDHYDDERARWLGEADSARAELVSSMVEGRSFDPASAGRTLRYELNRDHVALILWADPQADELATIPTLKRVAASLARAVGGSDVLMLPAGQSVLWAWTAGEHVGDEADEALHLTDGVLAAVGERGAGPEGFVRSHHQARRARRMATVGTGPPETVVLHRSVSLSSLLTEDLEAAAEFVKTELGALNEDTEANARLRETLTVFLEENMSWGRAGRRLGVHQNTVMYRVRQAEEMLGRPAADRRLELETALRLVAALSGSIGSSGSSVRKRSLVRRTGDGEPAT